MRYTCTYGCNWDRVGVVTDNVGLVPGLPSVSAVCCRLTYAWQQLHVDIRCHEGQSGNFTV